MLGTHEERIEDEDLPPTFIGSNDFSDLGVIVDHAAFVDDDDELSLSMDLPSVIDEESSFSGSLDPSEMTGGTRVMKNGKVRRKLRWKPPGFGRKKKANVSSNQSVVSALTTRSTATNKSTLTSRSFLSQFSKKSQQSSHTFHSTATPVIKNSKQSQHTFQRPNYNDTFEFGLDRQSTIDSEGRHSAALPLSGSRQSALPASTALSDFIEAQHENIGEDVAASKTKRPPLFKRIPGLGKSRFSHSDSKSKDIGNLVASRDNLEGISPLSQTIVIERQEDAQLPALESEDYEDDRRITLYDQGSANRSASLFDKTNTIEEELSSSQMDTVESLDIQRQNQCSESVSIAATSVSSSSISSANNSRATGTSIEVSDKSNPVITSHTDDVTQYDIFNKVTAKGQRCSGPVDLDDNAFEAEHNLRAIHDMATEHLAHGEYDEAVEVFEEILRGQEARYGEISYRVGTALHNLGLVYMKAGNYVKAIETSRKAVSVRKAALVPNHPEVAVSLAQLGGGLLESRQYADALASFQEALDIRREQLGPNHLKSAKILNSIGCVQYSMEMYDVALCTFGEALEIQRTALKAVADIKDESTKEYDSSKILLSVASTLCNIASIKSRQGEFEDADHSLEEALLIQQSVLSEGHPTILTTLESMQMISTKRGEDSATFSSFLSRSSSSSPKQSLPSISTKICTDHNLLDTSIGIETLDAISPHSWFEQLGDAIVEKAGCSALLEEAEKSAKGNTKRSR